MIAQSAPRLLVADDDPGVLAAYRIVLEKAADSETVQNLFGLYELEAELFGERQAVPPQWRVTFVDQGLDAVNAVKWARDDGDSYHAIFLDVRMPPGIDGLETARRIRLIDPNISIIVVTGYSDYKFDDFSRVAGPPELLTMVEKPLWPEQLRRISNIIRSERSHRAKLSPFQLAKVAE